MAIMISISIRPVRRFGFKIDGRRLVRRGSEVLDCTNGEREEGRASGYESWEAIKEGGPEVNGVDLKWGDGVPPRDDVDWGLDFRHIFYKSIQLFLCEQCGLVCESSLKWYSVEVVRCIREQAPRKARSLEELGEVSVLYGMWFKGRTKVGGEGGGGDRVEWSGQGGEGGAALSS
ncbi:hypothetical protein I352_04575 [Cryptococcus deuterogattii MMRL2647]|nr:hypothetical protein I352_04575 [Cryptococcus deuterogattii MMRL2647]